MNAALSSVRVCVWDFDGTFYLPNPDLWKKIRQAEYQTIVNHTGWTLAKAAEEFAKVHKVTVKSATETVGILSGITTDEASREMEQYFDRREFVAYDEQLVTLLTKTLRSYTHIILANGVKSNLLKTLEILGIPEATFDCIVTSEMVGVNKPNSGGYEFIEIHTGLPREAHLMIGDREEVDLVTAKNRGWKTCLVHTDPVIGGWNSVLSSVYDIAGELV